MTNSQKRLIEFVVKYPDKWHSYAPNKPTVEVVCATSNLGIIRVNECEQFQLKSLDAARRFLG